MQILPIGSGKGGVGKSLIATNLAIALAQAGKQVVLADLDLGASNIHTLLGFRSIARGIGTYLNNPRIPFAEIVLPTEYEGLRFVPGDAEIPGIANLKVYQKQKLIRQLLAMEADFLILDLGAGTHSNVIDFFLTSANGIVVTTHTLTSILNAYLFLKNTIFRVMYSAFPKTSRAFQYLEELRVGGNSLQRVYIPQILARIKEEDPESHARYRERARGFRPQLVLNMLEDPQDDAKAGKLRRSCQEYLDINLQHLGVIYRDDLQDIALSSRLPILIYKPNAILSQAIYRLADKLIQLKEPDAVPIDTKELEESYLVAEMEAETDYQSKLQYLEELLHTGALTMGDLIETIKSQQFEITQLRRENQLIKTKLAKAITEGYVS